MIVAKQCIGGTLGWGGLIDHGHSNEKSFMDTTALLRDFDATLHATREIATNIASKHAADVDAKARFPQETVDALKRAGVLSAPVPRQFGGAGCTLKELVQLCATLSAACGSSGLVLAMHFIQVACIVRHGQDAEFWREFQRSIVRDQLVLASMTSEVDGSTHLPPMKSLSYSVL